MQHPPDLRQQPPGSTPPDAPEAVEGGERPLPLLPTRDLASPLAARGDYGKDGTEIEPVPEPAIDLPPPPGS